MNSIILNDIVLLNKCIIKHLNNNKIVEMINNIKKHRKGQKMKVYELLEKTSDKVFIYENYFDLIIGVCDGKNGVSFPILKSNIEIISLDKDDNGLVIVSNFNVYDFIDRNFKKIENELIKEYCEYLNVKENIIIKPLKTTKNINYYLIDDMLYSSYELKEKILNNENFLKYLTSNWGEYEQLFELDNSVEWGF